LKVISDQISAIRRQEKNYAEFTEDAEFAEKRKRDSSHKNRAMEKRTALRGLRSE